MLLNQISNNKASSNSKRLGRGIGSGKGKTCGRGHKGQKSRSGVAIKGKGFEGGQMPLFRRLPKRGFSNKIFRTEYQVVNVCDIEAGIEAGRLNATTIDKEALVNAGLARKGDKPIKLLARGEINIAITIAVDKASEKAKELVEKAGGKVSVN